MVNTANCQGEQPILRLQTIESWTAKDTRIMLRIRREEKGTKVGGIKDVTEVKLAWPDLVD